MYSLENQQEADKALNALTEDIARTEHFEITNKSTTFLLILVLAEGYDTTNLPLPEPPPEFQRDTGLTITGQSVAPGTTQIGRVQAEVNVQANVAKCNLRWRRLVPPHNEGDLALPNKVAPEGYFLKVARWSVVETKPNADGQMDLMVLEDLESR